MALPVSVVQQNNLVQEVQVCILSVVIQQYSTLLLVVMKNQKNA